MTTPLLSYARDVGQLLTRFEEFVPTSAPPRAGTRYEAQAVRAGRTVHDLAWQRRGE